MPDLRITQLNRTIVKDTHTFSATFRVGRREQRVWFRTTAPRITDLADPFLPVGLIPSMRRGWGMEIHGPISTDLLQGVQCIQNTLVRWYSDYRIIPIQSLNTRPALPNPHGNVGAFFSGGIDSFYTLQQHRDEITHLIFVHGFDVPLGRINDRQRIRASLRMVAAQLDLQLIEVETNLRQFGQPHVSWEYAYVGAALGSVALLLSPLFSNIYLPGTLAQHQLDPEGTHPNLDPHWSNGAFHLIHDGLEADRFQKIQAICTWPLVQGHLRVCYQKMRKAMNCCKCQKCLWTMMMLRALGVLDGVVTFDQPLDAQRLRFHRPLAPHQRERLSASLAVLEARQEDQALQGVLRAILDDQRPTSWCIRYDKLVSRGRNYLAHRFSARGASKWC